MNYEAISVWSQGVSALLFLALLILVWMKYIQPAIMSAQAAQNQSIAEAERHRAEAMQQVEQLQSGIGEAQRDAETIKTRVIEQGRAEAEALLAESVEAGERAVRNAQGELERARASARAAYAHELLERALAQARERAASRVDTGLNEKLLAGFLSSLERGSKN